MHTLEKKIWNNYISYHVKIQGNREQTKLQSKWKEGNDKDKSRNQKNNREKSMKERTES